MSSPLTSSLAAAGYLTSTNLLSIKDQYLEWCQSQENPDLAAVALETVARSSKNPRRVLANAALAYAELDAAGETGGSSGGVTLEQVQALISGGGGGASPASAYDTLVSGLPGLRHRWKFDDDDAVVRDSIGNLHLTLDGNFDREVVTPTGKGTRFKGCIAQGVGPGNLPKLDEARCFGMLLKPDGFGNQVALMVESNDTGGTWFGAHTFDDYALGVNGNTQLGSALQLVDKTNWHVLLVGYQGGTIYAAIDGVLIGVKANTELDTAATRFSVGWHNGYSAGHQYRGVIDDVFVLDRWPNRSEIDGLNQAINRAVGATS